MKSIFPVSILLILLSTLFLHAQTPTGAGTGGEPPCYFDEARTKLIEEDSEFLEKEKEFTKDMLLQIDQEITKRKKQRGLATGDTIPVVFHILYECGDPEEFISTQRILEGLQKVNEDFQGLTACDSPCDEDATCDVSHPNLLGCSPDIHFKLADRDTLGNPTTGINRIKTPLTSQGIGATRGLRRFVMWPRERYLNIYVLADVTPKGNSGHSFYPETAHYDDPDDSENRFYDGVSVAEWAVSPDTEFRANYGYILTHEIGHWLGLRHIWGGSSSGGGCNNDDFDFLDDFEEEVGNLFGNELDNQFNDTPNSEVHSIRDSCHTYTNTCDAEIDMYDNFMDYTGCAAMFSQGQMGFMDLVLTSSIADRNVLISNETRDLVFDPGTQVKKVVFTDNLFYEGDANNGGVNGTVEIKLKNLAFKNSLIGNTLNPNYYSVTNLPTGINASVMIINSTTAELSLSGTTTYNQDIDFDFTFGSGTNIFLGGSFGFNSNTLLNPFTTSKTVPLANRTKKLRIDFIENQEIQYTDIVPNGSVGPVSKRWAKARIKANDAQKSLYLSYLDGGYKFETDKFVTIFVEETANDTIAKTFVKGDNISGDHIIIDDSYEDLYDLYIDQVQLDANNEFYVGVILGTCTRYYGWLRLEKDTDCEQIIVKDFAVNTIPDTPIKAGELSYPVLSRETNIMEEGESFLIELLPTSNNEEFASNLIGTTLSTNLYTVTEDDNMPDDFDEADIEIEILNENQAMVKASTNWAATISREFTFNLDFDSGVFAPINGTIPTVIYDPLTEVYEPMDDLYWNIYEEGDKYIDTLNNDQDYVWVIGENDYHSEIGLVYSKNDQENAYLFYRSISSPNAFEALCYPNSNEVMILGYGDEGEDGIYKLMDTGGTHTTHISDNEVYLAESTLANHLGQEIYILFRTYRNCDFYYGSLKILVGLDGSIEVESIISNTVSNDPVFTGEFITECLPSVRTTFYTSIKSVQFGSEVFTSDTTSETYTDYTSTQTFVTAIDDDPAITLKTHKDFDDNETDEEDGVFWYIWIDYNRDNLFMTDELVFFDKAKQAEGAVFFEEDGPVGIYKMRVVNSLHELKVLDGCSDFKYGEVEDYMVNIESICSDDIVYDAPISSGTYSYDETITCQDDFYVGSQENVTLVAGEYVLLTPNSFVNYGSTFEAYIEACGVTAQKKEGETFVSEKSVEMNIYPNPCSSEFKVAYTVEEETPVTLEIYNSTGRVVQTVMTKEMHTAGSYTQSIDGSGLADGIYVVKIITQDKHISQKLIKIQ